MRKISIISMFLIMLFIGCDKQSAILEDLEQQEIAITVDPMLEQIADMGFDTTGVYDIGEAFIVEGDIKFSKKGLETIKNGQTKQAYGGPNFLVSSTITYIDIFLDQASFNSLDLVSELYQVIDHYNYINCSLFFRTAANANEAEIIITQNTCGSGICAIADFPLDGDQGDTIIIDEQVINTYGLGSHDQMKFLIAHEIGHCIGLRHTNWDSSEPMNVPHPDDNTQTISAITIPDTDNTDPSSVFNSGTCGNYWSGFSLDDMTTISYLYPPPLTVGISGSSYIYDHEPETYSVNFYAGKQPNTSYTYQWNGSNSRFGPWNMDLGTNSTCTTAAPGIESKFYLKVTVTGGGESDSYTRMIYIDD